ncbi:hypothetical protein ACLBXM_17030 [Xanthobacteraceae bacterium A53D]
MLPISPISGTYIPYADGKPVACTAVGIATDGPEPEFIVVVTVPVSRLTYIARTPEFRKDPVRQ